jgi:hypothetical protein
LVGGGFESSAEVKTQFCTRVDSRGSVQKDHGSASFRIVGGAEACQCGSGGEKWPELVSGWAEKPRGVARELMQPCFKGVGTSRRIESADTQVITSNAIAGFQGPLVTEVC